MSNQDTTSRPTSTEIMALTKWDRMPGDDIRWHAPNDQQRSPADLTGQDEAIDRFTSANGKTSIHVLICSDGGVISYELASGGWLHTLQRFSVFRRRIFELNLVPLEDLRQYLTENGLINPNLEPGGTSEA